MKPDKPGIWEWFDSDGTKRLVEVFDIFDHCPECKPYLRVYWWGGYYNVNDVGDGPFDKAEWPDRWGNYVGENESIPNEQLYLMPTPEQFEEIKKKYEQTTGLAQNETASKS